MIFEIGIVISHYTGVMKGWWHKSKLLATYRRQISTAAVSHNVSTTPKRKAYRLLYRFLKETFETICLRTGLVGTAQLRLT